MNLTENSTYHNGIKLLLFTMLSSGAAAIIGLSRVAPYEGFENIGIPFFILMVFWLMALPFYLIFFVSFFLEKNALSRREKVAIIVTHLMITTIGYLALDIAYRYPYIDSVREITVKGFMTDDSIQQQVVYQNENLGFYIIGLGFIGYWVYQVIEREMKEIRFSALLFPILFTIIYFFIILDFPLRPR